MGRRPLFASLRSRHPFGGNLPPAQEQRRGTRNGCTASHGENRCQGCRYHGKRELTFIGTSAGGCVQNSQAQRKESYPVFLSAYPKAWSRVCVILASATQPIWPFS